MTALPRATCPFCERDVALRVGGELREHEFSIPFESAREKCPASGHTVEQVVQAKSELATEVCDAARS